MRRLLLTLAVAISLSGCGLFPRPTTIDGFTPGSLAKCSPPVDVDPAELGDSCAVLPTLALAALDARAPGHAAIVSMQMYTDGKQPADAASNVMVFVFTLADGSTKATGVACSGDPASCVGVGSYPN
jgi:hypothetical protein